jgi:hypothetical protein
MLRKEREGVGLPPFAKSAKDGPLGQMSTNQIKTKTRESNRLLP